VPAYPHLHLRAETKPGESRTPLVPDDAQRLRQAGFGISVETSSQRCFADRAYVDAGCHLVPAGSWQQAPREHWILGLKELPPGDTPLQHRHIYFAHAFKQQRGWQGLLRRFAAGDGALYDLEYLTDGSGRRLAAFGFWAGFVGAGLAVMCFAGQRQGLEPALPALTGWASQDALLKQCREALAGSDSTPRMIVIGARGRVGRGALKLASALGLDASPWDMEETARGGPFDEILDHDILVNCVLVDRPLPPFVTSDMTHRPGRRLRVIADVSCDPHGDYNPLPLYRECTSTGAPLLRLQAQPPLDLIAIDNLPSLLPRESSEDFSAQLLPVLRQLPDATPWQQALAQFHHHRSQAES
jgi:saccharopine dehydrogenase (NAD+, L-lysine forming)